VDYLKGTLTKNRSMVFENLSQQIIIYYYYYYYYYGIALDFDVYEWIFNLMLLPQVRGAHRPVPGVLFSSRRWSYRIYDDIVIAFSKICQQNTSSLQQVLHNTLSTMSLIQANGRPMNRGEQYIIIIIIIIIYIRLGGRPRITRHRSIHRHSVRFPTYTYYL